jgi:hypothetical protein
MRALPCSSLKCRAPCARITREPARKLPRRHDRTNILSAASLEAHVLRTCPHTPSPRAMRTPPGEVDRTLEPRALGNLVRSSHQDSLNSSTTQSCARTSSRKQSVQTAESARAERASDARTSVLIVEVSRSVCANHWRARTQAAQAPRANKHLSAASLGAVNVG